MMRFLGVPEWDTLGETTGTAGLHFLGALNHAGDKAAV